MKYMINQKKKKYKLENQIIRLEDKNNYIKSTLIELLKAEKLNQYLLKN